MIERILSVRVLGAIGWVTFLEIVRDKILYNIILFAMLLLGVTVLASQLTFIHPERVIVDFGISAINISCSMIAILLGASLIGKEFERRTIWVALSHPISRGEFVLGKFLGLSGVVILNWAMLCLAFLGMLLAFGGTQAGPFQFQFTLFFALFCVVLQSLVLMSLAILLSTFSTTSLTVMMMIGFYLLGSSVSQIRLVAARLKLPLGSAALNGVAAILPNLENFNLGLKVTYGLPVTWQFGVTAIAYGICLSALFLFLAGLLIQRREA